MSLIHSVNEMSGVFKIKLTNLRHKFLECENHLKAIHHGSAVNLKGNDDTA